MWSRLSLFVVRAVEPAAWVMFYGAWQVAHENAAGNWFTREVLALGSRILLLRAVRGWYFTDATHLG